SWLAAQELASVKLFEDDFGTGSLAASWSARAPGGIPKTGSTPVSSVKLDRLDPASAPSAGIEGGSLQLLPEPSGESVRLATRASFDWTSDAVGGWIQATFELAGDRVGASKPAERIGYYVSLIDHEGGGSSPGGNILLDGNPAGGAEVHI